MSNIESRPKTIFCDIDGTLIKHRKPNNISKSKPSVLPLTLETLVKWDRLGYNIVLTTGRKESLRRITEKELSKSGIIYDKLITGLGGGDRILVNDKKSCGRKTAWSLTPQRDVGLANLSFENLSQLSMKYFEKWSRKDIDSISRMFSDDVELKDWNVSCVGRKEVVSVNKSIFQSVEKLSVTVHEISHQDNTVFCQITINADEEKIPVVDVIRYNKDAKISSIIAYRGN